MDDLISRQDAIDAMEQYLDKFDCIDTNFLDGLKTTKKILNDLPSSQPKQRWIPCSERLPEKGLRVLMYLNNSWQLVGWYDKEGKQWYALPFSQEVVNDCVLAWMPLPEDYEEDD